MSRELLFIEGILFWSSINLDNIISVGAMDSSDNRCSFSNFGRNTVDIFAPGEDVFSTFISTTCNYSFVIFNDGTRLCEFSDSNINYLVDFKENNGLSWSNIISNFYNYFGHSPSYFLTSHHQSDGHHYCNQSGTSMATPFVTGVAALLLSINPNLTTTQLKTAIMNSAKIPSVNNINPLENLCVTNGKLDAFGAVKYVIENYLDSSNIINLNCTTTDIKMKYGG